MVTVYLSHTVFVIIKIGLLLLHSIAPQYLLDTQFSLFIMENTVYINNKTVSTDCSNSSLLDNME